MNVSNLLAPGTNPLVPLLTTAAVTAVVLVAVFVYLRSVLERHREARFRQAFDADGVDESLIRPEVLAAQRGPGWSAGVDQQFDGFIKQTGLNWTAGQALGLMALLSVALAGGLFLWRDDLLMIALGLLLGQALPVAGYVVMRRRQRRKLQDQLPDALFLVARTLRAGLSLEQSLATVAQHGTTSSAVARTRSAWDCRCRWRFKASLSG